jgi:hypothetical protein
MERRGDESQIHAMKVVLESITRRNLRIINSARAAMELVSSGSLVVLVRTVAH